MDKEALIPKFTAKLNVFNVFVLSVTHLLGLLALLYPSWRNFKFCMVMYCIRMFVLHAGCHRLFAHRSFKTTKWFELLIGFFGCSTLGNSPLFWATHHRLHHQFADSENDLHSPVQKGFLWAHMGWSLFLDTNWIDGIYSRVIPDWLSNKKLVWMDDNWYVCMVSELLAEFSIGGKELVLWSILSMVLAVHAESLTNSAGHLYGSRPFQCQFHSNCDARNNWFVALINGGEGWHNNHHAYMSSARHGFYWWQLDVVYLTLKLLSLFGIVWDLQQPPLNKLKPTSKQ